MIQVFASYAYDHIDYTKRVILGWPAYYLEHILSELGSTFSVLSWEKPAEVFIYRDQDDNDAGYTDSVHPIKTEDIAIDASLVIISTIWNEIDLRAFRNIDIPLFIDIQWFIRGAHGDKLNRHPFVIWKDITVYKCTGEEFSYIDPELLAFAREDGNIHFVVTHGGNGIDIYNRWIVVGRMEEERIHFLDTIGAWDIFLWACAHYFDQWNDLVDSVRFWSRQARLFLEAKQKAEGFFKI